MGRLGGVCLLIAFLSLIRNRIAVAKNNVNQGKIYSLCFFLVWQTFLLWMKCVFMNQSGANQSIGNAMDSCMQASRWKSLLRNQPYFSLYCKPKQAWRKYFVLQPNVSMNSEYPFILSSLLSSGVGFTSLCAPSSICIFMQVRQRILSMVCGWRIHQADECSMEYTLYSEWEDGVER